MAEDSQPVFPAIFFVFDVDPQHFGFVIFGQIAQKKLANFGPFHQVFARVFVKEFFDTGIVQFTGIFHAVPIVVIEFAIEIG